MANTKISALTANTNPNGNEEFVYAFNNANGKITLDTMKTFASADSQATLVSGVNIKTINWTSILGSGNIDVSWWGGWGWFEPTELWWDANIWELSEWVYTTEYQLYYTSGNAVPAMTTGTWRTRKQMLFVVEEDWWAKWYFVFSAWSLSTSHSSYASYWYSYSSSNGNCRQLADRMWTFNQYNYISGGAYAPDALWSQTICQVLESVDGQNDNSIRISTTEPPYVWVTYTIVINSVSSAYSITLWTWVTNPLNIALPTNSNKTCVMTFLITSSTTAVVTGCTMWN